MKIKSGKKSPNVHFKVSPKANAGSQSQGKHPVPANNMADSEQALLSPLPHNAHFERHDGYVQPFFYPEVEDN